MVTTYVKGIQAEGIYGRFDIEQEFGEGINIVYGRNGAGKTTLLHILANALNGDFARFDHLKFGQVRIQLGDGKALTIRNKHEDGRSSSEATLDGVVIYPRSSNTRSDDLFPDSIGQWSDLTRSEFRALQELLKTSASRSERMDMVRDLLPGGLNLSRRDLEKLIDPANAEHSLSPLLSVAYFPAFRTMIEAWAATGSPREHRSTRLLSKGEEWRGRATEQARDWFGAFTPTISYPSLVEIEDEFAWEISRARSTVWNRDHELVSQVFMRVIASLSDRSPILVKDGDLLRQIQELSTQLELSPMETTGTPIHRDLHLELSKLHNKGGSLEHTAVRILQIYRDYLESSLKGQRESFKSIDEYISSVHEFLQGDKCLAYKLDVSPSRQQMFGVRFADGSFTPGLRTLSSGERQILTLIYASTHMSQQSVVLIDEPEISLHVDWQRKLISKMVGHIGDRQIIACTHSPVIAADYQEQMRELQFLPSHPRAERSAGSSAPEGTW